LRKEIIIEEKIKLLERELLTLTEKLEVFNASLKEIEDLKHEIKGLKIFIGREHPDFKGKFPEIMQKIFKKS
jgi:pyruvate formate-lyase activating enzyme-like uncharacterized protein